MRSPFDPLRTQAIARLSAEVEPNEYHDPRLVGSMSRVIRAERYSGLLILFEKVDSKGLATAAKINILGDLEGEKPEVTGLYYEKTITPADGQDTSVVFNGLAEDMRTSGLICIANMLTDLKRMDVVTQPAEQAVTARYPSHA